MAESNSKLLYEFYKRFGICVRCGQENAVKGKTKCDICLKKDADSQARHREKRTEEKIIKDRNRMKEYYRRRYYELKEKGKCVGCGKQNALESKIYCSECNTKNNRRKKLNYKKKETIDKCYEEIVIPDFIKNRR